MSLIIWRSSKGSLRFQMMTQRPLQRWRAVARMLPTWAGLTLEINGIFFSRLAELKNMKFLNSIFRIPEFVLKLIHIKRHRRETIYKRPKIVYPTEENY